MTRVACLCLALALLTVRPASASDSPRDRATLKGLKGVVVIVESLEAVVERDGLTASQLQTDVELRLRQSGIRVIEAAGDPDVPVLYVNVNAMKQSTGNTYVYEAEVSVFQTCRIIATNGFALAQTWSVSNVASVGVANFGRVARDLVRDETDTFINAFLSVNSTP